MTTAEPPITPRVDRLADQWADALRELGESVAELRRALAAHRLDRAQRTGAQIQNACARLDFRSPAIDLLDSLARLVDEHIAGRSTLSSDMASGLQPIVDAMEAEVALMEEQL